MAQTSPIRSWLSMQKKQAFLIGSLAFIVAWVGVFEFTNTFFFVYNEVVPSVFSSFVQMVFCFVTFMALFLTRSTRVSVACEKHFFTIGAIILSVTSLLVYWSPGDLSHYLVSGIVGGVSGTGLAFVVVAAGKQLLAIEREVVKTTVTIFLTAFVILVLCMALSEAILPFVLAALPLLAVAINWRGSAQAESKVVAQDIVPLAIKNPTVLKALLFFSGFLLEYMVVFHPKSSRGAGTFVDIALGGLGTSGLLMLALSCVLLILITIFIQQQIKVSFVLILLFGIFAAAYSAFPFMQTSPIPFILVTPCALCCLLLALYLFAASFAFSLEESFKKKYFMGWFFPMLGALCASSMAIFFFEFIWDTPFQRQYIIIPTAAVALLINIFLIIMLRDEFLEALFVDPKERFTKELDTSDIKNRCKILGERFGLTAREVEVLELVAEGRNAPYIEKKLVISRSTVKTHLSNLYKKAGVGSRQALLDLLYSQDILSGKQKEPPSSFS